MRERKQQINFRTTKTEKDTIHCKAKRCGMTDADYIRNCALDRMVIEMPREGLMTAYRKISVVEQKLERFNGTEEFTTELKSAREILLDLYRGKEVDDDGGDEDLDGNG
ncbi:MAG: hypothetical protein IJQ53_05745 [Clostridia bacterium]|nr:hypothetical protein [Clostridia bacterium]